MTDTTDKAALMLKMRNLADRIIDAEGENNNGEVGKIIEMYDDADTTFKAENILLVLSAFEEQRQRADANAQEIRRLEFQWEHRAPTQWAYDQACKALRAQHERAETAETEIAALKGDQVPVAWRFKNESGEYRVSIEKKPNTYGRTDFEPLFTAPQKPVVRFTPPINPAMFNADVMFGYNKARAEDKAAIEFSGIVVRDGE